MKVNCLKENLSYGLQNVQKAISSKKTLPILDGILIKAENNHLILKATDMELGIETRIPANVISPGEMVVTSNKFIELIKKLPNVPIDLEQKGNSLSIHYLNSSVELKGWSAEEFPEIPDIAKDFQFTLTTEKLNLLIRKTLFASSTDESRPAFNGALLHMQNQTMKLITTDSHRLAIKTLEETIEGKDISVIIPRKTLNEVQKIFRDDEDQIIIYGNERQVCLESSDTKVVSRIIDGKFPNFEQVIPKSFVTTIRVNKKEFSDTIERAGLFSDNTDHVAIVRLAITDGNINITSRSETGSLNENVNAYLEGDKLEISFNSRYLLEALRVMEEEDITFRFSGSLSPAIITEFNGSYTYLVLPLRAN